MTISRINAEANQQVRDILQVFPGRISSIPTRWYYTPFISQLMRNTQPFHPRREGLPGTETIFQHTLKDMTVLHCFLVNEPVLIKIDEITFPSRSAVNPTGTLRRIVEQSQASFGVPEIVNHPRMTRILDAFTLYHDIGKQTENRIDHERTGAEKFLTASSFFSRFLTNSEIQTVYMMTKYHGIYTQLCAARREGQIDQYCKDFTAEMMERGFSTAEKEYLVRNLFLFTVVEGLQSDVSSASYYSTDKFEDILNLFEMIRGKA